TEACPHYSRTGGGIPDGLDEEVAGHVAALEEKTGKRFGDRSDPLLVSVRSGAAISMPGMMDTTLNVTLDDKQRTNLRRRARRRAGRGAPEADRHPPLRLRLLPATDPDVRRDGRRD